jgi:hypothetical protein
VGEDFSSNRLGWGLTNARWKKSTHTDTGQNSQLAFAPS